VPATCAICLQPIVTRNDVRVFGTEVMHRACAASGQETIGSRQRAQIAELRLALAAAQEGERRQTIFYQQMRHRAENAIRSARLADERVDNAGAERDLAVEREVRATIARDAAIRERDAARADLAKRNPDVVLPTPAEDTRDGSVIRYSLLELD
jgi:hypothetical protein